MSNATRLTKASSVFFFFGFTASKIRYVPIVIASALLSLISLGLYLIGYLLWFIGSHIQTDHSKHDHKWYGFAQFKEQYRLAALLGLVATAFSAIALFAPVLIIPAVWLFLGSNIFWAIGEYHKLNHPPQNDPDYSQGHQLAYLSYAITMSVITLLAATSTTLILLFPPLIAPIMIVSTVLSIGLGTLVVEYWLSFTFGNHPPTPVIQSDDQMAKSLVSEIGPDAPHSSPPFHGADLFAKQELNTVELKRIPNEFSCNPI